MTAINFDGKIFAADTETRTLRGLIVPFGAVGNTSAGAVEFHPEAFGQIKAEEIVLNMEHERTRPLGRGIAGSEKVTPAGIEMAFKIAPTTAGTDALIEAAEGLRPAFSIEATADEYTINKGVMQVTRATLTGVAHVTNPAFKAAQITEVAASEDEEQTTEAEEAATELTEETTVEDNKETAVAEEVEAAQVAPAPVQASAPIRTAPRSPIVNGASYLEHSIKAAMGSDESRQYVRAADESTSTNTGLTLAPHLNEFITTSIGGRPTIEACSTGALPASGMSFTIPKLTQAPTVGDVDEGASPFGTAMTSDYLTVNVNKYAGASRISWELIDRSSPAFLDELLREMQLAYAKATDVAVISAILSGGTDATAVSGDAAGLQAFIATEGAAAYKGSGNFARNLVANTDMWAAIMGYQDGNDRPLFNAAQPMNAAGNVQVTSIVGNVLGTNLYVDPHYGAGTGDDKMLLLAPEAVTWYESATRQVQVNVIGSGELEVSLYGYGAIAIKKPLGVRIYQQS
jgi:HK97 family phage major capsid protein